MKHLLLAVLAATLAVRAMAERAVELEFTSGGVKLAGTLYLPEGAGPFPAIVCCHGSGPATREEHFYNLDRKLFIPNGVAVLLYDKRGCGKSGGTFNENEDYRVLTNDLIAGVEAVKARPEIDGKRLIVKGVSQGGWLAPLAATICPDIAGVIAISGPGTTPAEQGIYQRGQILLDKGLTFDEVNKVNALRTVVWRYYGTGAGYPEANSAWQAAKKEPWFEKAGLKGEVPDPEKVKGPEYAFFRQGAIYDPVETIAKLQVPVVAVFGDLDRFIPVLLSVARWQKAIEVGHLKDATVRVFEGAGHGINKLDGPIPVPTTPQDHAEIMKKLSPAFADGYEQFIINWVLKRFRASECLTNSC